MKKTWLITVMLVVALALAATLTACVQTPEPLPTYTVTVAQVSNGSVTITGVDGETHENYEQNSAVTVNVAPAQGYEVASVTVDGNAVNLTNGKYTFAIKANANVAATFQSIVVVPTYTVTVGEVANGTVAVTDVHGQAQTSYEEGSVVVVSVTPAAHYQVASVTVGGKAVNLTEGQYGFVIGANTQVAATFSAIQHEVVASYNEAQGSVVIADAQGNEASVYNEAAVAKISVVPANGYEVDTVKVDGTAVALTEGAYSLTVNADAQVEVTFKLDAAHKALQTALAEVAASNYLVIGNQNTTNSSVTEYPFVVLDNYMVVITGVNNYGPSGLYGLRMYDGYARGIYSFSNSASGSSYKAQDYANTALYKTIADARIDYNVDNYMQYFTYVDGKYVLVDNDFSKEITAEVLSHLLENITSSYYSFAPIADLTKYSGYTIELNQDGHISAVEFNYTDSSSIKHAKYLYTIGGLTDETNIEFMNYNNKKQTTIATLNACLENATITVQSTLTAYAGTFTNAEEEDIVIAKDGITVDGVEMIITKFPSWLGGPTSNNGTYVEGTINGVVYRLTYLSAKRVSLIADGEAEATIYAIGGIKDVVLDINAMIGTYEVKDSYDTYTVTITDANTATYTDKQFDQIAEGGEAEKVEYKADTQQLVLTINGKEYTFGVVWDEEEGICMGLTIYSVTLKPKA